MKAKAVSGIMLTLLLTSMLTLAFNIQPAKADWTWTETIYIRADGSVYPDTAPISTVDNITYTFKDNIVGDVPGGMICAIVVERDNIVVDGAGYTLQGTGAFESIGIFLGGRSNVTVKDVEVRGFYWGIFLNYSHGNTLSGNTASSNTHIGIWLFGSSGNVLSRNTAANNTGAGIDLYMSSNNNILSGNNASSNNYCGIGVEMFSSNNIFIGNTVSSNTFGGIVLVEECINNTFIGNTISSNTYGIFICYGGIYSSTNNTFFHNNFINNGDDRVPGSDSINTWDDGYPSGGNYWSDYDGTDVHNGPYQNETGSDGIGDTPYVINENNIDRYPLMEPWIPPAPSIVATIDIEPDTLNLKSNGEWITAYIELPEGYNVNDIDVATILLNGTIPVDMEAPVTVGDYDSDSVPDLMVKFDRASIIEWFGVVDYAEDTGRSCLVALRLTGEVSGATFEGSDTFNVLRK